MYLVKLLSLIFFILLNACFLSDENESKDETLIDSSVDDTMHIDTTIEDTLIVDTLYEDTVEQLDSAEVAWNLLLDTLSQISLRPAPDSCSQFGIKEFTIPTDSNNVVFTSGFQIKTIDGSIQMIEFETILEDSTSKLVYVDSSEYDQVLESFYLSDFLVQMQTIYGDIENDEDGTQLREFLGQVSQANLSSKKREAIVLAKSSKLENQVNIEWIEQYFYFKNLCELVPEN